MSGLERFDRHVEHGQMVSHEEGIGHAARQRLHHSLQVPQIEVGVRECSGIAPRPGMNADGPHECPKMQLPWAHFCLSCRRKPSAILHAAERGHLANGSCEVTYAPCTLHEDGGAAPLGPSASPGTPEDATRCPHTST